MEKNLVGYRFAPSGEELINYYLKNKILGKSWLVDEAISEINICNYDPIFLPSLSKLKSDDPVWYFFSPKEYISGKKKASKRTTSSGYWKATGVDRKIKGKGRNGGEIGIKKTLVYYEGRVPNGVWTPWVMHEYHITCLPQNQRNYVICQVMYKGEDGDIPSGGGNNNNSSEPSYSLVSDSNTARAINTAPEFEQPGQEETYYCLSAKDLTIAMNHQQENLSMCDDEFDPNTFFNNNVQPQTPCDDEYWNGLLDYNGGKFEDVIPENFMFEENCNYYRPRKALSGIIVSNNSDSEPESISATSYEGTLSPGDSIGSSSNKQFPFPSCSSTEYGKDLQTSSDDDDDADSLIRGKNQETRLTARHNIPSKQDASIAKTEKKGLFVKDYAMAKTRKNPKYVYLMNMIIGLVLLVGLISDIVSVLSTVKT